MPDISSDSNSNIDSMLGAFFGNVSQRAFGRMGAGIETLENKFKQLGNVAQSRFGTLRTGADRFGQAVESINRGLREQADRIRRMPRLRQPPPQTFPQVEVCRPNHVNITHLINRVVKMVVICRVAVAEVVEAVVRVRLSFFARWWFRRNISLWRSRFCWGVVRWCVCGARFWSF